MRFRKKPVVIDAIHFLSSSSYDEMLKEWDESFAKVATYDSKMNELNLRTLESRKAPLTAIIGDWIIRGVQGEFYPCAPNIFEQTYEPDGA